MSETLEAGTHLRYSLSRNGSRGAQIGCTLLLAALLGTLGGGILFFALRAGDRGIALLVGGAFALVALVLLYSAVHQTFALKTPQTIVEIDRRELRRESPVQLYFRQPGPASFESLRANLVGEERWSTGSGKHRRHHVEQLGVFNLYDSGPFEVDGNTPFEDTVTAQVPDLPHAAAGREERWQLEVWGKVRGRADFQHVFPIVVDR
jgi:hypothetical protein